MANNKESTFLNMTLTLFLVTAVAAFSLGSIYNLTKDRIAEAEREKTKTALGVVLPGFDNDITADMFRDALEGEDELEIYPARKGDELIGYAVKTYSDLGFTERIWIMVGFLADGTLYNTAVLQHKETPGLGDKMDIKKDVFPEQFMNKHPDNFTVKVKKDGGDVDAITAATITSRAFCDAVDRAYKMVKKIGGNE